MKKSITITALLAVLAIVTNAQTVQYETIPSTNYETCVERGWEYSLLDSLTFTKVGDLYRISGKITTFERTRTTVKRFSGLYAVKSTDTINSTIKTDYETTDGFDRDRVSVIIDEYHIFVYIQTFRETIIPGLYFSKYSLN